MAEGEAETAIDPVFDREAERSLSPPGPNTDRVARRDASQRAHQAQVGLIQSQQRRAPPVAKNQIITVWPDKHDFAFLFIVDADERTQRRDRGPGHRIHTPASIRAQERPHAVRVGEPARANLQRPQPGAEHTTAVPLDVAEVGRPLAVEVRVGQRGLKRVGRQAENRQPRNAGAHGQPGVSAARREQGLSRRPNDEDAEGDTERVEQHICGARIAAGHEELEEFDQRREQYARQVGSASRPATPRDHNGEWSEEQHVENRVRGAPVAADQAKTRRGRAPLADGVERDDQHDQDEENRRET